MRAFFKSPDETPRVGIDWTDRLTSVFGNLTVASGTVSVTEAGDDEDLSAELLESTTLDVEQNTSLVRLRPAGEIDKDYILIFTVTLSDSDTELQAPMMMSVRSPHLL